MFKYTPKQEILDEMTAPREGRWWDVEYFKRKAILERHGVSQDFIMTVVLQQYYPAVCFYSATRCTQVPVRGYLFPVSMFDESA